jgi:hypothetical protein
MIDPRIIIREYTIEDEYTQAFVELVFKAEVKIDHYIVRWKDVKQAMYEKKSLNGSLKKIINYFENTQGLTDHSGIRLDVRYVTRNI